MSCFLRSGVKFDLRQEFNLRRRSHRLTPFRTEYGVRAPPGYAQGPCCHRIYGTSLSEQPKRSSIKPYRKSIATYTQWTRKSQHDTSELNGLFDDDMEIGTTAFTIYDDLANVSPRDLDFFGFDGDEILQSVNNEKT